MQNEKLEQIRNHVNALHELLFDNEEPMPEPQEDAFFGLKSKTLGFLTELYLKYGLNVITDVQSVKDLGSCSPYCIDNIGGLLMRLKKRGIMNLTFTDGQRQRITSIQLTELIKKRPSNMHYVTIDLKKVFSNQN